MIQLHKTFSFTRLALILLLALSVSACIDSEENSPLNTDLSSDEQISTLSISNTLKTNLAQETIEKLPFVSAYASAYYAKRDRFPENTIDDVASSKWSSAGAQWIILDLGEARLVTETRMAFYGKNRNKNFTYNVSVSDDEINWTDVLNNKPILLRPNWTTANFAPIEARYIRYTLNSSTRDWFSVYDIEAYGTNVPTPLPELIFNASNDIVKYNGTSTLTWSTLNASICEASGDWMDVYDLSGEKVIGPLNTNSQFTLSCFNEDGANVSQTININVQASGNYYNDVVEQLTFISANASAYKKDRYPANTIDDVTWSKWSSGGAQWIVLDLGETKLVSETRMAFYGKNKNINFTYDLSVSDDSKNWLDVVTNQTLKLRPNWTLATFTPIEARYIRYTLNSDTRDWFNVYDIEAFGSQPAPPPPPTLNFNAALNSVEINGMATLTWEAMNVAGCEASADWVGDKALSSTQVIGPLLDDQTYTLTCLNDNAESVTQTVTVTVYNNNDGYNFDIEALTFIGAEASAYDAARSRVPSNAIDGNERTKWTVQTMPQWIIMDLGELKLINESRLLMYGANQNKGLTLTISTSQDKRNWVDVVSQQTPLLSPNWTKNTFSPVEARYVRVALDSSDQNAWANVYEFEVNGSNAIPQPTVTLTSNKNIAAIDEMATLSWNATNVTACEASGDWTGSLNLTGTETVGPMTTDSNYTITCYNDMTEMTTATTRINVYSQADLVSSTQKNRDDLNYNNVFDGDYGTRWSSEFSDEQWIIKDLGNKKIITNITLYWESAYGEAYEIQTSDDLQTWTTVYTTSTEDGDVDNIQLDSASTAIEARFIKMNGITRGTKWGYSLYEFEVNTGIDTDETAPPPAIDLPSAKKAVLSWNANTDLILGYIVNYGPTAAMTDTEYATFDLSENQIDPAAPGFEFDPAIEQGYETDDQVCFKVRAYNSEGFSGWTSVVCGIL